MPEAFRGRPNDLLLVPMTGVGVEREAIASASQQPRGLGLDQPGVPAQLVEDVGAERDAWQEYYQIGVSLQQALRHAYELHTSRAHLVHQVSVSAFV